MTKIIITAADVQGLTATVESTERGTMSNVQVNKNYNRSTDFKEEWVEGYYDEWIFVYHPNLKLLLITYAHSDYENIYERLVKEEDGKTFTTKAEKTAYNVEKSELLDAVVSIISKDDDYLFVKIDWSNKEDVDNFINS